MNCYICASTGVVREAIGAACRHCQAPLCAEHLPERAREDVAGAVWCCTHAYALPHDPRPRRRAAA
jgi:hypothetical protein